MRQNKNCLNCKKIFYKPIKCGITVWDKRKFCSHKCYSETLKGRKLSQNTREKMRKRMLGNKFRVGKSPWSKGLTKKTDVRINKLSLTLKAKGIRPPKETELKNGHKALYAEKGENHWNWQGGKSTMAHRIRQSKEYKLWRKAVFERDNYICIWCGAKFIKGKTGRVILHADHIKPFSLFPELRFAIDNGRTLCVDCHKKTFSYRNNKLTKEKYE